MPAKRCVETKNMCLLFVDYCTLIGVWVKSWHFHGFLPNSKILTVPSSFPVLTLRNALLLSFQRLDNPPVQSHLLYLKLHE